MAITPRYKEVVLASLPAMFLWSFLEASEYKDEFRANYQRACIAESVTGPDAIPLEIAESICRCIGDELTDNESDATLRLFDARPTAFQEIFQVAGDKCANLVLSKGLPTVGSGPQIFKCSSPDGTVACSEQPCPGQVIDTWRWGGGAATHCKPSACSGRHNVSL